MARTPTPVASATAPESDTPAIDAASAEAAASADGEGEDAGSQDDRADATIEVRVLVDHLGFRANTLALLTEAEAADCAGWADPDPAAVAYVKSLADQA